MTYSTRAENIFHRYARFIRATANDILSPSSFFIENRAQSSGYPIDTLRSFFLPTHDAHVRGAAEISTCWQYMCTITRRTVDITAAGGRSTTCTGTQNYSRLHLRDFRCTHTHVAAAVQAPRLRHFLRRLSFVPN